MISYKIDHNLTILDNMIESMDPLFDHIIERLKQLIEPRISIDRVIFARTQRKLLEMIRKYAKFTYHDFIAVLIYVDRLFAVPPEKFLNQRSYNRILLILIILYSKMYNDHYYSDAFYGRLTMTNIHHLREIQCDVLANLPLFISCKQFEDKLQSYSDPTIVSSDHITL
jgi:hypothetical protein